MIELTLDELKYYFDRDNDISMAQDGFDCYSRKSDIIVLDEVDKVIDSIVVKKDGFVVGADGEAAPYNLDEKIGVRVFTEVKDLYR